VKKTGKMNSLATSQSTHQRAETSHKKNENCRKVSDTRWDSTAGCWV